jgi:hypothetical protein
MKRMKNNYKENLTEAKHVRSAIAAANVQKKITDRKLL